MMVIRQKYHLGVRDSSHQLPMYTLNVPLGLNSLHIRIPQNKSGRIAQQTLLFHPTVNLICFYNRTLSVTDATVQHGLNRPLHSFQRPGDIKWPLVVKIQYTFPPPPLHWAPMGDRYNCLAYVMAYVNCINDGAYVKQRPYM